MKKFFSKTVSAAVAAAVFAAMSQSANAGTLSYTGAIQQYTVTSSGTYHFSVAGAQGGASGDGDYGGDGALVSGDVHLTAGTVLDIVVGGQGHTGNVGGGIGGDLARGASTGAGHHTLPPERLTACPRLACFAYPSAVEDHHRRRHERAARDLLRAPRGRRVAA